MKTSARNHFAGTVRAVNEGAVNDEIEIEVPGGALIVATVTRTSRAALGLDVGASASALIKSSAIILMTGGDGAKVSARNRLDGVVSAVTGGAVNSEVVLDLSSGGQVVAIVTNESVRHLALAKGVAATALFKASSVIVAVD